MPTRIGTVPAEGLGIVVVIPCRGESDLNSTLEALWHCRRPACSVEVITVINASQADRSTVHARNHETRRAAEAWISSHRDPRLAFHVLWMPALPARDAGSGLARRIGMDEALGRLHAAANPHGIIVSLDALRTFRFVRWAGTNVYARMRLERAVEMLLSRAEPADAAASGTYREARALLAVLRDRERREIFTADGC